MLFFRTMVLARKGKDVDEQTLKFLHSFLNHNPQAFFLLHKDYTYLVLTRPYIYAKERSHLTLLGVESATLVEDGTWKKFQIMADKKFEILSAALAVTEVVGDEGESDPAPSDGSSAEERTEKAQEDERPKKVQKRAASSSGKAGKHKNSSKRSKAEQDKKTSKRRRKS